MNKTKESTTRSEFIEFWMPDGRRVPYVLSSEEVVEFLRLEGKNPLRTLKYWRDTGMIKGIRLGRRLRYSLPDVLEFLDIKSKGTKNKVKTNKEVARESREELRPRYVKNYFTSSGILSNADIPDSLVEVKKEHIKLHRQIKKRKAQ